MCNRQTAIESWTLADPALFGFEVFGSAETIQEAIMRFSGKCSANQDVFLGAGGE
jgi:hypothetical protein